MLDLIISPAHAQAAAGAPPSPLFTWGLMAVMIGIFYFMLIRPQQKRVKEHSEMVGALQKGDEVVTNGGLGGTIAHVGEGWITLRLSQGVEVKIQKQAVAALLPKGTLKDE